MNKLFEITYDNTIPEIETAFRLFQKKYALRRLAIFTVVYLIVIALGVNFIVTDYTKPYGYILCALGLGVLVSTWTKPAGVRKRVVATLSEFSEEKYTAVFSDDRIEICTEIIDSGRETETVAITGAGIIPVEDNSEAAKELAESPEKINEPQVDKSVYKLAETELCSEETDDCYLLYVNRSLIYVFPKRCLSQAERERLASYFDDKSI